MLPPFQKQVFTTRCARGTETQRKSQNEQNEKTFETGLTRLTGLQTQADKRVIPHGLWLLEIQFILKIPLILLRECTEIVSTGIEMPFYDDKTGLRRFPSPRRRAL
jgi:hypothetical protein